MKRQTTITLTIAGLLGLTGVLYGAHLSFFSNDIDPNGITGPISVVASPTDMYTSDYCGTGAGTNFRNIKSISCDGTPSVVTAVPALFGATCEEMYMAFAPLQSASATPAPFTPRDVFITNGVFIYKFTPPNPPNPLGPADVFAVIPDGGCDPDHTGITFDHTGNFGYNMIVTCKFSGNVWKVDGAGVPTQIAQVTFNGQAEEIESPVVMRTGFGPQGGQIWVVDEDFAGTNPHGAVHAIDSSGNVTLGIFQASGAESILPIPEGTPCTFCNNPAGAAFQALTLFASPNGVYQYTPLDLAGVAGDALVNSENGAGTSLITTDGTKYFTSFFDSVPGAIFEGTSLVDCDVPTPTPTPTATFTPTPTATFTPTATATFTPTATATFTPTATATFTPTATATFTPTATATFTPTPTATFTPTATATFTPTATATFTPTATATFTPTATATFTPTPTPTPTPTAMQTPTPCALTSCSPPYPFVSSNPRTNIAFNESEVLRAFRLTGVTENCIPATLQLFYNDEHAMTLGIRQTKVITPCGPTSSTTTTNYPFSAGPTATPTSVVNPQVGATEAQGGTDTAGRPMFPSMYITDVTASGNPLSGDWQFGGTAIPPNAVFGTWKGAVKTIDNTTNPATVTVTPDADPPVNNWNLGLGSNPVPTPTPTNQGYGAECRWDMTQFNFIPGHQYRLYFIVHDGDQNHTGGDVGQACVFFTMAGPAPTATPSPTATATATPTPTATPATVAATSKSFGGSGPASKTVTVTFQNNTAVGQVLTGLSITWPQATNGNLQQIKMGGTTIFNTQTGGGSLTTSSLQGTTAQRTIAAGSCATLTFSFQNNVNTNPSSYTGTATFNPFGPVPMLP